MEGKIKYKFSEKVGKHSAPGGWYFITVPKEMSKEIRTLLKNEEKGWGRLKAIVIIGKTEWKTAIWFDSKKETYLLPLKLEVRRKENIEVEKQIEVVILL